MAGDSIIPASWRAAGQKLVRAIIPPGATAILRAAAADRASSSIPVLVPIRDVFKAKMFDLASEVFAHVSDPSIRRFFTLNFWRDKMVRIGMGEGKLSDGISKLVADHGKIKSGKALRAAVVSHLGKTEVNRTDVLKVFGPEDFGWQLFFENPQEEKLRFRPDLNSRQIENLINGGISETRKKEAMLGFYKQSQDVRHLLPWYVSFGFKLRPLFNFAVGQITRRFVIAPTLEKAVGKVQKMAGKGIYATMDLIGESAKTEADAVAKFDEYRVFLEKAARGEIQIPNLSASLKLTAITTDLLQQAKRKVLSRLGSMDLVARREIAQNLKDAVLSIQPGEKFEERVTDALWGVFADQRVRDLFTTAEERAALVELFKGIALAADKKGFDREKIESFMLYFKRDIQPADVQVMDKVFIGVKDEIEVLKDRMRTLLRLTIKAGARLTVDMEQYRYKDITLKLFREILEEDEFQRCDNLEIVVQAYLEDAEQDIASLLTWAEERFARFGVRTKIRLVKGAYTKSDPEEAVKAGLPRPLCKDQDATNANYIKVAKLLMDKYHCVKVALASHNPTTIFSVLAYAIEKGIKKEDLEIQMLYGMSSSPLLLALAKAGYKVAYYTPIGKIQKAIEYLARRMDENKNLKSCLVAIQEYLEEKITLMELLFGKRVVAVA
ncbi:MAG: proline dehydrogenase family protein [Candidatus Saganbacteria bacterium]|nr:proline dehydrogenase family protein [Candidatus Saganbacteria bacterium]